MKISLSFVVFGKGFEFCWGKEFATIALVEVAATILGIGIDFALKV